MAGGIANKTSSKSRLFSRPLLHINRRHLPVTEALTHVSSSATGLRRPKICYYTSYNTAYKKKNNVEKRSPRPLSPTRKHCPHPTNVYYLKRLDLSQVVCDVKTDKNMTNVDLFGVPYINAPTMFLKTCTKDTFQKHNIANVSTRYGSNKEKTLPTIGIVPVTPVNDLNLKQKQTEDHWLPGTLKLTTTMTMTGPYQYLPRKRKQVTIDASAAGTHEKPQSDYHRYHYEQKRRGKSTPIMTIRSGI